MNMYMCVTKAYIADCGVWAWKVVFVVVYTYGGYIWTRGVSGAPAP